MEQVDFEWMVEQELNPDDAVVEQLRRGSHMIERLRRQTIDSLDWLTQ